MMLANHPYWPSRLLAICCLLLLSACARMALDKQLAVSKEAIEQAKVANAPEFAPAEFGSATDKLARADVPADTQEIATSMRLAQQSQADANLAHAKTEATRASIAAAEIAKSNQALAMAIHYAGQPQRATVRNPQSSGSNSNQ